MSSLLTRIILNSFQTRTTDHLMSSGDTQGEAEALRAAIEIAEELLSAREQIGTLQSQLLTTRMERDSRIPRGDHDAVCASRDRLRAEKRELEAEVKRLQQHVDSLKRENGMLYAGLHNAIQALRKICRGRWSGFGSIKDYAGEAWKAAEAELDKAHSENSRRHQPVHRDQRPNVSIGRPSHIRVVSGR